MSSEIDLAETQKKVSALFGSCIVQVTCARRGSKDWLCFQLETDNALTWKQLHEFYAIFGTEEINIRSSVEESEGYSEHTPSSFVGRIVLEVRVYKTAGAG